VCGCVGFVSYVVARSVLFVYPFGLVDASSLIGFLDNEEVILHANISLTRSPSVASVPG
jgi:hypothetical protein